MIANHLFNLEKFIPAPESLYSPARSTLVAAAMGLGYGFVARIIYPQAGIVPLNYAVWFSLAYQIKNVLNLLGNSFEYFIHVGHYFHQLELIEEQNLDVHDQLRYHCWKIVHLKNKCVNAIDHVATQILNLRPSHEIKADNVMEASFLEMCRYRIGKVFKSTIMNTISSSIAYRLVLVTGLNLPHRTSIHLFIVIKSIFKNIILIPSLYIYARMCNQLVDELGDNDQLAAAYRVVWIKRFLPAL